MKTNQASNLTRLPKLQALRVTSIYVFTALRFLFSTLALAQAGLA